MLDERKEAILHAVVREYIATGQPVGSAHVSHAPEITVSSATVRNEMAVLEQEGYLVQPHTSAGRVPTDKAYRLFVDHLARPGHLEAARVQQVRAFFEGAHGALERMLQDTTRLLTRLTDYAAVVVASPAEAVTVRSVQLVGLAPRVVLAVVVLSNGSVENETVEWRDDVSDATIAAAQAILAGHVLGRTLHDVGPIDGQPAAGAPAVAQAALDALAEAASRPDEHLYVGGASTLARSFEAVEVVRGVLQTLEQQYVVVTLLRDMVEHGLSVAIGAEHGVQQLAACSVVVAPYVVDGEQAGTVGLLGPTRMDYPQVLAAVEVVSHHLGERLSEADR